jgi:hypothetical protein
MVRKCKKCGRTLRRDKCPCEVIVHSPRINKEEVKAQEEGHSGSNLQ